MMRDVMVHVGYPKAASTTLQKHLFSKHSEIEYYGNYPTNNPGVDSGTRNGNARFLVDRNLRQFYVELIKRDPLRYDHKRTEELLTSVIANAGASGRVPVMSHERFLSVLFWHHDLEEKARRLKALIPNARVLIVVRNQRDMVVSQYRNHPFDPRNISAGIPMSFSQWLHTMRTYDDEIGYLRSLKYSEIAKMYEEIFGKGSVKVLCADDLSNALELFSNELSEFMFINPDETASLLFGRRENVGLPSYFGRLRRNGHPGASGRINRYLRMGVVARGLRYVEQWTGKDRIPGAEERLLRRYFSDSNKKLTTYLGDRVQRYSFPM